MEYSKSFPKMLCFLISSKILCHQNFNFFRYDVPICKNFENRKIDYINLDYIDYINIYIDYIYIYVNIHTENHAKN